MRIVILRVSGTANSSKSEEGYPYGLEKYAQRHNAGVRRHSGGVTDHSGHVTSDSGPLQKTVTINQNRRSRCLRIRGHDPPESLVTVDQNT
ncbi:MAG: hypothetical protein ACREXG_06470, partial [Polaromonas sp.]